MEIQDRIRERRKALGLSAEYIAEQLNVSPATIYRYENKDIKKFPIDILEPLAKVLHTTPGYLMGWDSEPSKLLHPEITDDVVEIPVIGEIAAGYDELAVEDWTGETVKIPIDYLHGRKKEDFFVLTVHGDSMYPIYMDGDKVLILRQETLNHSGEIGAVLYDGEMATLKRVEYVTGEDWMKMIPVNPNYPPKMITGADLEQCRILGIPKLVVREVQ